MWKTTSKKNQLCLRDNFIAFRIQSCLHLSGSYTTFMSIQTYYKSYYNKRRRQLYARVFNILWLITQVGIPTSWQQYYVSDKGGFHHNICLIGLLALFQLENLYDDMGIWMYQVLYYIIILVTYIVIVWFEWNKLATYVGLIIQLLPTLRRLLDLATTYKTKNVQSVGKGVVICYENE